MAEALSFPERACVVLSKLFKPVGQYEGTSGMDYCRTQFENANRDLALFKNHIAMEDAVVLDAGCSLGGKTVFYATNGPKKVFGLEREAQKLDTGRALAREKGVTNVELIDGDISEMPFADEIFDVVFLNDVVEHIPKPILRKALQECRRVLKPDGKICIEFPPWTGPYAAHVYGHIPIPWCHFLFTDETLMNVTEKYYKMERKDSSLSFREFYFELNRLDTRGFTRLVNETHLKFHHLGKRVPKNISLLKQIPYFNKYFTMRVIAVLGMCDPGQSTS